jgi:hypothetical protein
LFVHLFVGVVVPAVVCFTLGAYTHPSLFTSMTRMATTFSEKKCLMFQSKKSDLSRQALLNKSLFELSFV